MAMASFGSSEMEMAMASFGSSAIVSISTALLLVLGLPFLLSLLRSQLLRPWFAHKAFVRQGFHVLPYAPITGDLLELKRMERAAQSSPMPSPSRHHHLLFQYLFPFFHKHLSAASHPGVDANAPFVLWWGNTPMVAITHPEDAKCVMTADVKHFKVVEAFRKPFLPLLGNGLLLAEEETWQHHRAIMKPAFFAERLKEMIVHMTTSTMEMIDDWKKQVIEQGSPLEMDVAKPIKATFSDILSRSFFGPSHRQGKEVFDMQVELLGILAKLRVQNTIIPGYRFIPTRLNFRRADLQKRIHRQLHAMVESRRKRIQSEGGADGSDLLGLILRDESNSDKNGPKFTTQEIIDECKTFFFAGHETTANLLAWTIMLLSTHQEWQERARKEVLEVYGNGEDPESYANLSRLKVVSMVLNETLRLYTPTPEFGRRIMKPSKKGFQLGSRTLPPGTAIVVESLYIHRRKDIWGDDADEFKPERFSDGVANACRHPYGFIPFGIGPRNCIGQHFAMLEARVMLALVLRHFRFCISPNYRHAPFSTITLQPRFGIQVMLEPI